MNRGERRAAFRRAPLTIEFGPEDGDGTLDGLWMDMVRLDVAGLREITSLAAEIKAGDSVDELDVLTVKIGECLLDWNWTHPRTGVPVDPKSPNAVDTLDGDLMMLLIDKWQGAIEGVKSDLGKESGSTPNFPTNGTSPAPIPVTENRGLSAALANLPTHSG